MNNVKRAFARIGAFLALFAGLMLASNAHAQTINVLRGGPVGAGVGLWAEAVADTLRQNGYEVNVVGLENCKQVGKWIKSNPDKPYAMMTYSDYAILDQIKPEHPAACGYELTRDNLVTIAGRYWNFICGKQGENDSIAQLRAMDGKKLGVWNYPVAQAVVEAQMKHMGSSVKVIGFASGKQMLTAFNTGDIDYIVLSSENLVGALKNPSCFATAADSFVAKAHMPNRVSYDVIEKMPFINYGLWPMIAAGNTDVAKLRYTFSTRPSATYVELVKHLVPEVKATDDQMKDLNTLASNLKGLIQ